MTLDCSGKNRLIYFGSIGLNIFLIAFIIGRCHWFHPGQGAITIPAIPQEQMQADKPGGRGYGMFGHTSATMSQVLFSQVEIEANRQFIDEGMARARQVRIDLAKQLRAGHTTPESIKEHLAAVDAIMKEIKDRVRQKAIEKITAMSPEEKNRLADILEK